ncbi:hypothetical protein C0Q70_18000 [Pomacea canaliculata]|uniref:Choline transporter-like protein n=1 Tax=Pomacea canaliculata TaxID=400727 RepID=A0A2T7NM02_POMCA|nr:hypothetical protein C0Q70_18000 [Pomacea canaliculata]
MAKGKKNDTGSPKEHDPSFKGPVSERSCTDVVCCILFILCILGAAVCSIIGYARGDPNRLVYATDSAGNFCGQGKFQNKSFLFFFDLIQCAKMGPGVVLGCPTPQVCVSECPQENFVYLESVTLERAGQRQKAREKLICKYDVDPQVSTETIEDLVKKEMCAAYYVASKSVINRCIPAVFNKILDLKEQLKTADNNSIQTVFGETVTGTKLENGTIYLAQFYKLKGYAELVFKDLCESWPHIIVGLVIATVISFLWIVLLRYFVGVIVWLTLILFAGLFAFSSYYSYRRYYDLKGKNLTSEFGLSQAFVLNFEHYLTLKETWLAFGCTSATLLAIFLLIVIVLARRICIAIELIKEGSRYTIPMQLYMLFMFFWLMNFVVAFGQMTLAGAFATFYWSRKEMPPHPLLSSFCRCLRYHLGSLAFGSLIIASIQLIRSILEYMDRKLKSSENSVAKFILKCLKCCFWCLEKILKFINKNAYIMIAIYGRSFCTATKDAFMLIMRNVLRTYVLDKVSDFIMFISKLMVTGGVAIGAYYWFENRIPFLENFIPDLHFRLLPVIILVLGTYLVTSCFFNVYDMAVDTLFLCFLEDLERNDGSPEKPYQMSSGLKTILRKDVDEVDNVHVEGASNIPAENAGEGRLRAGSQVEGGTETLLPAEQEADAELKAAEDQDATDQ